MPVSLLFDAKRQFFDDNGVPLAGGRLHTYQAGTSTNKTAYTDYAGAIPHANPIILDSAGRTTVYGDGSYKLVLRDADNVVVWTEDNLVASSPSTEVDTVADLKALSTVNATTARTKGYYDRADKGGWSYYWDSTSTADDDGGMVLQPDSAPAAGRWLGFPPINGVLDAKVYGVKLDGVTNDLPALQKCDTYCSDNKIVMLLQGVLSFSSVFILSSKVRLGIDTQLVWTAVNPNITLSPDVGDASYHFNCSVGDVPVLDTPFICPEWFGETASNHPKTTACLALSPATRKIIFTGVVSTRNAEMN